jgi:phage terminase large subunit-like protein
VTSFHEWSGDKGRNVWTVLTNGTGARRQPMVLQITTAGFDEDSVCFEQYSHGRAIEAGDVTDPRYHFCWIEAPADADYRDPKVWREANPSFGVTVRENFYADRITKKPESVFRRYFLNQWTEAQDGWIPAEAWDVCAGTVTADDDADWFVGVDIGRKKDSTAIVAAAMIDNVLHVRCRLLIPTPQHPVAVADARAEVAQLHGSLRVHEVVYDPYMFGESAEILEEQGLTMVEFPQTDARMAPASETLYELIREGRLIHDGDPELRRQMLAAVPSQTERGVRISKRKSKKRIDAAVALAMAADRAVHGAVDNDFIFETF